METYQQRMRRYQTAHDEYTQNKAIVDEYNNLTTDIANLTTEQRFYGNSWDEKEDRVLYL